MPRYIEDLNECTDPVSGDFMWLVDASAGSTDKDRKVDVGKFARLAVAQTFSATQTFSKIQIDSSADFIDVDSAGAVMLASTAVAMADNEVKSLPSFIGVYLIVDFTNGNVAMFALRGGVNATQEVFDPSGIFSVTKDTASMFNVYYETGYKLQNKRGSTKSVMLIRLGSG